MATHRLRTWPEYFDAIVTGKKTFEVRNNDRDFKVGDLLVLREWDNEQMKHTGRETKRRIIYILPGGQLGIHEDFVVLSIQ